MTKETINLSAFKDGVADAVLEGSRSSYHPDMYYYKQGYDFGLTMYNEFMNLNEEEISRLKKKVGIDG